MHLQAPKVMLQPKPEDDEHDEDTEGFHDVVEDDILVGVEVRNRLYICHRP